MLDMKNLSKIKYIYRIYESIDKTLHLEKHPVIYINKEVVYFKMGRMEDIHHIHLDKLREELKGYYTSPFLNHPCYNEYYFTENIDDIYMALKQQQEYYRTNESFINVENRYNNTKKSYEKILKEYESAKAEYEARISQR